MKHIRNSAFFFCLALIFGLGTIACGEANSNSLPGRSDSANENQTNMSGSGDSSNSDRSALPANPAPADSGRLEGTWYLVAILPSDTAAGKLPTITFDETAKKFTGNTGCNNMQGTYRVTDSSLRISDQIVTTRMACPGYNEDAFLKNLPKATGYRFENGMLVLMSGQTELSRWTREPAKPIIKTA